MTAIVGQWAKLDTGERWARLRSLQALTRTLAGPQGEAVAELLRRAEADVNLLPSIDAGLARLPTAVQRRILLTYSHCLPMPPLGPSPRPTERQAEIADEFKSGWRGRR